jgi:uncharacterized Zn finger protein
MGWRKDALPRQTLPGGGAGAGLARLPGALTGAYPECSTAIWRKKAERLIAETDLKSYE